MFDKQKKLTKKSITIISSILLVLVIFAGAFVAYYMNVKKTVESWENKIYPGISINNIDLGGKTMKEAKSLIDSECSDKLLDKDLIVKAGDKEFNYKYSDIEAQYDIDKALNEAISKNKDLGIFKQNKIIKGKSKSKNNIELDFTYNEEKLVELEQDIKANVNVDAQNAILHFNGGSFSVTPDVVGYQLNEEGINDKFKAAINDSITSESIVELEVNTTKAYITQEALSRITGRMSYFQTAFNKGYDTGRDYNLSVAASQVNGTLLMPGETFSYSQKTKAVENQYVDAMVIGANNEYVPGNAGGICQVSTTLYNAVMGANIRSTERHNHSIASGYVAAGLDATVAWGYLDYKFTNTYDFPIYISAGISGNHVYVSVYGDPSALGGKTYAMTSDVQVNEAQKTQVAKTYLVTYQNGQEVNREYIDTSNYVIYTPPTTNEGEVENTDTAQPETNKEEVEQDKEESQESDQPTDDTLQDSQEQNQ